MFYKSIGISQSVFVNGKPLAQNLPRDKAGNEFKLDKNSLKSGVNRITIIARPLIKERDWSVINMDPGLIQIVNPAPVWKRKLFSGLAQVIVQSTGQPGEIVVTANSIGLKSAEVKIEVTAH